MARRTRRWAASKAALRRLKLLDTISDGRWYGLPSGSGGQATYRIVAQLEDRGLLRVDRTQRRIRFRIVYPPELASLEDWADYEMRRREAAR